MVPALALHARLIRFALVGGAAGVVDMVVLQSLFVLGGGLYASRVVSYLCAATFAWWFNRRFTFAARRSASLLEEWGRYLLVNLGGGLVNYAVYAALVSSVTSFARYPFLAVAVGAACGLLLNFAMSSWLVFRSGRD